MQRREFITLLGGAAVWPVAARAQARPVIGYLGVGTPEDQASTVAGFRKGLNESGYFEGRDLAIEFRWADRYELLSQLGGEWVRRRVNVLFMNSPSAVRATMEATRTIPIVFIMGEDPVKEGIVPSLNRPGANVTGITDYSNQLNGKLLGLLHDTVPKAKIVGLLVNPTHPNVESDTRDAQAAADALGLDLRVVKATNVSELEAAFKTMTPMGLGALMVNIDPFLSEHQRVVALASQYSIPTIFPRREDAEAGGLMSYQADRFDTARQAGGYIGRILKGTKPTDLPVLQATKFNFVINLKTAKALGLAVPPSLLAVADEVIE
jgi:putative tryptophan/tyrosine transport system substrate-binding protein